MVRISLVSFLNAAPLGWAFLHGPLKNRFKVVPATPAHCARQLAMGEVEIGLIPSIEYQRIPNLRIIPGVSIASRRDVRSVVLVRNRGKEIRSVALDTSSRTSVVLLKVLLNSRFGLNPEFLAHPPDLPAMLRRCDAALLIGDQALKLNHTEYEIMDLAKAWVEWQQRPFVFAFWACRDGVSLPGDLVSIFQQAKQWGLQVREQIAESYAAELNLSKSILLKYLSHNIDYDLAPPHIESLERFYRLAYENHLVPGIVDLRFQPAPGQVPLSVS